MLIIFVSILAFCAQNCYGFFNFDYDYLLESYNGIQFNLSVTTKWIDQPLDHNNPTTTWKMRYFESLDFFSPGGPILLFINGEADANPSWLQGGLMSVFGQQVKGAMFLSEHRFYGQSVPNNDMSVQNLAYLSSMQALADLKHLIEDIKSRSGFENSKVIVFGGSYAGNLAAWMKMLYPDVVDAAHSSSAPVLAKTDFYEYLEVVGDTINKIAPDCYNSIVTRFQHYDQLLQTPDGIEKLKTEANICPSVDMNQKLNQYLFFEYPINSYSGMVQYGTPDSISSKCSNALEILKLNNLTAFNFWDEELQCLNVDFNSYVNSLQTDRNFKSWFYQICTEFGYMQTTTSKNQPFTQHVPVEFYVETCKLLFGSKYDLQRIQNGVDSTNGRYGGQTPNVQKVVFVNGDMDPWHPLGVLHDLSDEAPARVIPGASHCSDLSNYNSDAAQFAMQKLREWIGL